MNFRINDSQRKPGFEWLTVPVLYSRYSRVRSLPPVINTGDQKISELSGASLGWLQTAHDYLA